MARKAAKTWWILGFLAAGLTAGIFGLERSGLLLNQIKQRLIAESEKASGRKIEIDSMQGGLFGTITLKGVRIGPPGTAPGLTPTAEGPQVVLSVERVDVSFSLWRLLFHGGEWVDCLRRIDIFSPLLTWQGAGGASGPSPGRRAFSPPDLSEAFRRFPPLPAVPVYFSELALRYLAPPSAPSLTPTSRVFLEHTQGVLSLQKTGLLALSVQGAALGAPEENFSVEGGWSLGGAGGSVRLHLKKFPLAWVNPVLADPALEFTGGLVEADLDAAQGGAGPAPWLKGIRTWGRLAIQDGELAALQRFNVHAMNGVVKLEDRRLEMGRFAFRMGASQWQASGRVDDLNAPVLNLSARCPSYPLSELKAPLSLPQSLTLSGEVETVAGLQGPPARLEGFAVLKSRRASLGPLDLEEFNGRLRFKGRKVRLEDLSTRLEGGSLKAKGALEFVAAGGPKGSLEASVTGASLGAWLSRHGLPSSKGAVDLGVSLQAGPGTYQVRASFRSPRLTLGGEAMEGLAGNLSGNQRALQLSVDGAWRRAEQLRLRATLKPNGSKLLVSGLDLSEAGRSLAKGNGFLPLSGPDPMLLKIKAPRLSVGEAPLTADWARRVGGHLSLQAVVTGRLADPRLEFKAASQDLSVPAGTLAPLAAAGHWDGREAALDSLSLAGGSVQASATWGDGGRRAELTLTEAELPVLTQALAFLPLVQEGTADGQAAFESGADAKNSAKLDISLADFASGRFRAKTVQLKGGIDDGDWRLDSLRARQEKGGEIQAEGRMDTAAGGDLRLKGEAAAWDWAGRSYGGLAKLEGRMKSAGQANPWWKGGVLRKAEEAFRASGRLGLARVKVGDRGVSDLALAWKLENDPAVDIESLAWGAGVSGQGRLEFGGASRVQARLKLDNEDFGSLLGLLGSPAKGLKEPMSGSLALDWSNSAWTLRTDLGQAHGGKFGLQAAGEADSAQPGRLTGTVQLAAFNLAGVEPLLPGKPGDTRLSGKLDARLALSGTLSQPEVEGSASAQDLAWGDIKLKRCEARGSARPDRVRLERLEGIDGSGSLLLTGLAADKKGGVWSLQTDLAGEKLPAVGFIEASARGHATLEAGPASWKTVLQLDKVSLNLEPLPATRLAASYQKRTFRASATAEGGSAELAASLPEKGGLQLKKAEVHRLLGGSLRISGGQSDNNLDYDIRVEDLPAGDVARVLGWNQTWQGRVFGTVTLSGPADNPGSLIDVKVENGSVNGLAFDLFSGALTVADHQLNLAAAKVPVVLEKKLKYRVEASGTIPLGGEGGGKKQMDVSLVAKQGDLSLLKAFDVVEDASGPLEMSLHITGTPSFPSLSGKIQARGGWLQPKMLLTRLEKLKAHLQVDQNRVQIFDLQAQAGDEYQRLRVESGPLWNDDGELKNTACVLKQFVPDRLNLKISSGKAGVKAENRPAMRFIEGTVRPDLLIQGSLDSPAVAGSVTLSDAEVSYPPVFAESKPEDPGQPSLFKRAEWNLRIITGNNVRYANDYADVVVQAPEQGIWLKGQGAGLGAWGKVVIPRGTINYFSPFTIDDAQVAKAQESSVKLEGRESPYFDIHAYQFFHNDPVVRERTVYLSVTGTVGSLSFHPTVEPEGLSDGQIYSLIGLGRDITSGTDLSGVLSVALTKVLGWGSSWTGNLIKNKLGKLGPQINISARVGAGNTALQAGADPNLPGALPLGTSGTVDTGSGHLLAGAELQVGAEVAKDVYLGARVHMDDQTGGTLQNSEVSLQMKAGDTSRVSVSKDFTTSDYQVRLESNQDFGSYDPRKRRPSPTPTPWPTPTSTPGQPVGAGAPAP